MITIAAVELVEQFTERLAYLKLAPPMLPNVGDYLECQAQSTPVGRDKIAVKGCVVERTFVVESNGWWVCRLKMARHSFPEAAALDDDAERAMGEGE